MQLNLQSFFEGCFRVSKFGEWYKPTGDDNKYEFVGVLMKYKHHKIWLNPDEMIQFVTSRTNGLNPNDDNKAEKEKIIFEMLHGAVERFVKVVNETQHRFARGFCH